MARSLLNHVNDVAERIYTSKWNISVCVVTRIKKKIFDENSKKPFVKTYTFSNHDTNKFMILLQIVVYPNE